MHIRVPSLLDLCIQKTINNVRYLGDVGETELDLLDLILPHCTLEQLKHVENCSKGRDLTPITDRLWKKFFELEFGVRCVSDVAENMKRKKLRAPWKNLFEAKLREQDEAEEKAIERINERYKKEDARKQSRQVKLCNKTPPSGSKRNWGGNDAVGSRFSNTKSSIMKKAKLEFKNSFRGNLHPSRSLGMSSAAAQTPVSRFSCHRPFPLLRPPSIKLVSVTTAQAAASVAGHRPHSGYRFCHQSPPPTVSSHPFYLEAAACIVNSHLKRIW